MDRRREIFVDGVGGMAFWIVSETLEEHMDGGFGTG